MVKQINNIESLKKFVFKGQPAPEKKGINAYIYYRVSSLKQETEGKSLEWQKKICEEYCAKNGLVIVEYFGGIHESAKTDEGRKEFMRMMDSVKKGKPKINHIIVYSYDRLSRSGDTSLIKELRELGIKIHAVTQPIDDDTPSGRFFQSMHTGYSEWENAEREKKCREGMIAKLKKGEVITRPPIGYDKKKPAPGQKAQCVINDKGRLIRQAFYWAAEENISQAEVILRLRPMGLYLTPPQLSKIFRNVFYTGIITNNLLPGMLIQGKHEALISEEIFMKVNRILDNNHHGYKINKEQDAVPLKGFCKCGICGGSLTGYLVQKKYWYYKCKNKECHLNVPADHLNYLFTEKLEE
jgi:site-specific DNA recombinase